MTSFEILEALFTSKNNRFYSKMTGNFEKKGPIDWKLTERVEFQMFQNRFLSSWLQKNKQATLKWLQGQLQWQLLTM